MSRRHIWFPLICLIAIALTGVFWFRAIDRLCAPLVLKETAAVKPPRELALSDKKVIRILSINGGGVRGIIPLKALSYLEQRTGKRTAELFDLFAGVSVGGIISAGSLLPGPDAATSRYSADEILQGFYKLIPEVFNPSWQDTLITCDGMLAPKYSSQKKALALRNALGDGNFGDLLKPCLFMGFDMDNARPESMESWTAPWNRFAVIDLLNAGTAFPGVFNPVLLQSGNQHLPMLTDLGPVENDPSLVALQVARQAAPHAQIILVNLGTGDFAPDPSTSSLNRWGELRWITTLLPTISSGNVQATRRNVLAEQAYMGRDRFTYYSIDITIPPGRFYHPFNGSPENVANISQLAQACVTKNEAALNEIATLLVHAGQ